MIVRRNGPAEYIDDKTIATNYGASAKVVD